MPRATLKRALLGLCVALACGESHALEWRNTESVTMGASGDSNIWLDPLVDRRATSRSLDATADILAASPKLQLRVKPELRALRYADGADADRSDVFTNVDLTLRRARGSFMVGADYRRESTLTSGFLDAGLLGLDQERVERSLVAAWKYAAAPRGSLSVTASASAIDYGSSPFSPLVDYDYRVVQAAYQLTMDARTAWAFSATRSAVNGSFSDTTNSALQVRWIRSFTPTLRGDIGLGTFDVRTSSVLGISRESGAALTLSLKREWAHWTLQTGGARDLRPDGRGALVREDAVTVEAARRFGNSLSVGLSLRRAQVAATDGTANLYDRDYSQTGVGVDWRPARRWQLHAGVQQRMQQLAFAPRAEGVGLNVGMTYRGR